MRAADTNLVIRLLTVDDAQQFALASAFFSTSHVYISVTVLLESEWVLRRSYGFKPMEIAKQLGRLCSADTVTLEDSERVALAFNMVGDGVDFADALHLVRSAECSDFVTFDARLAKRASGAGRLPITLLTD